MACILNESPHLFVGLIPLDNCVVARLTPESFGFLDGGATEDYRLLLGLSTQRRPGLVGRTQNRGDFLAQTIQHSARSLASRVQGGYIRRRHLGKIRPDFAPVVAAAPS